MKYRLFVVDDDPHYARLLSYRFSKNPHFDVKTFHTGEEVLRHLDERPQLIFLDIMMPGMDGIEVLSRIKEVLPEVPVVMVSAQGVIDVAIEAMKKGAYDYVTKGQDDLIKLDAIVQHIVEHLDLKREVEVLRGEVARRYGLKEIIGDSPSMERVYQLIQKALRGDLSVAILGESGTGKELVARAIHFNSSRKRGPFVVVNCAAIPRDLMESEFFGHEKGAFTGAHARKIGKFEQADGGTLFLDEIGELDLELQAKLLRALQNREFQRVGGHQTLSFDARIICATNQNILQMIREGKFREDLYYRLFQFPIPLPPLRERKEDILLLAHHFLRQFVARYPEFADKKLSAAAKQALLQHSWPGNVRELKSAIERGVLMAEGEWITPQDLMLNAEEVIKPWVERLGTSSAVEEKGTPVQPSASISETEQVAPTQQDAEEPILSLEELKRQAVERAYRLCGGNVDRAAVELGIGRATMYRLLKKYHIVD